MGIILKGILPGIGGGEIIERVLKRVQIAVVVMYMVICSSGVQGSIFINEVFINPSESDGTHEFIELLGTPGMKLDGYAIAVLNGTEEKYYTLGSIPPAPVPAPEIDEFFSLDGLSLGDNGILGVLVRDKYAFNYPGLLSDSASVDWRTLWNGGLDVPGKLTNDGSCTIILIRNRPGITEADPCNPDGLLWGKEITHDAELFTPVGGMDQFGDGNLDRSDSTRVDGNTIDLSGLDTVGDLTDDLEIVDEVSYEDGRGWEYDTDGRHVDEFSSCESLPHRHVHALDDPANFNPDVISRVDYRTKGPGWAPSCGATGEMANNNNWQDTATEQWIRGSSVNTLTLPRHFYYDNDPNSNPNAVQAFGTHVPLWLDDGNGVDYEFTTNSYEILVGSINPLAVPFIPGDVDRDGICDVNDINKISSVFGDDDWIFSNSFLDAPETDRGDPATQTKPWDVDGTGDNGIEASDMQWVLNFQGDTTGQIVGIQYDSTTPASSGVYLNSNTGVDCNVIADVNLPAGRTLDSLCIGDFFDVTVSAELDAGANASVGQENGITQYIHDITIDSGYIIRITAVQALGPFSTTRLSLQTSQGIYGDLGVNLVNGYTTNTTSFTEGLTGPANLYRLTLQVVGEGTTNLTISPASSLKFANSTPHGLKVGHTDSNGDPDSSLYPAPLSITASLSADFDDSGRVDMIDFVILGGQWRQPPGAPSADIAPAGGDGNVDVNDLGMFTEQWLMTDSLYPLLADIDLSGFVDMIDFVILGGQWMQPGGDPSADIDPLGGDGIVDFNDLNIITEHWLMESYLPN